MTDSDSSSVTTLGLGEKSTGAKKLESDNDWQSIDLLLTQDEFSSGDEVGGSDDDDDEVSMAEPEMKSHKEGALRGNAKAESNTASTKTSLPTAQSNHAAHSQSPASHDQNSTSTHEKTSACFASPATRTLDILSQQSSQDLRYDMSQLEKDATLVMLSLSSDGSNSKLSKKQATNGRNKIPKAPQSTDSKKRVMVSSSNNGRLEEDEPSKKKKAVASNMKSLRAKEHDSENNGNSTTDTQRNKKRKQSFTKHYTTKPDEEPTNGNLARDSRADTTTRQVHRKDSPTEEGAMGHAGQVQSNIKNSTVGSVVKEFTRGQMQSQSQILGEKEPAPKSSHPEDVNGDQANAHLQPIILSKRPEKESDIPPDIIDHTSYYIQHITVDKEGSLGCIVAKALPPKLLMPTPTKEYCRIKSLPETSLAYGLGLRVDDWFCAGSSGETLCDYDEFVARVRSKERPLQLHVARKKGSYAVQTPAVLSKASNNKSENKKSYDNDKTTISKTASKSIKKTLDHEIEAVLQSVLDDNSRNIAANKPSDAGNVTHASKKPKSARKKTRIVHSTAGRQNNTSSLSTATKQKGNRSVPSPARKKNLNAEKKYSDAGPEEDSEDEEIEVELPNEDQVVPFCNLCNLQVGGSKKSKVHKRAGHHALCPKHPCYHNSTAHDTLSKIIEGIGQGCHVCEKAYEVGKASIAKTESHIVICPWRREEGSNNSKGRKKKKQAGKVSSATSKKSKPAAGSTSGKSASKSTKAPYQELRNSNAEDQPNTTHKAKQFDINKPVGKNSRILECKREQQKENTPNELPESHDLPNNDTNVNLLPQNQPPRKATETSGQQPQKSSYRRATSTAQKRTADSKSFGEETPKKRQRTKASESTQVAAMDVNTPPQGAISQMTPPAMANASDTYRTAAQKATPADRSSNMTLSSDGIPCKSKWVRCETNPWGQDGHMDGDVVLLTPAAGLGHYETLLSSRRFEMFPFSEAAGYNKTHTSGYDLVRLERDTMAQRSWGFTVKYHEFGGACLVESVDPLSPAEAAMSLGGGKVSGLRINDMIIAINGKVVGEMTEVGVLMEMETAGPWMSLLVSRYKFADYIANRIAKAEEHVVAAVDDAFSDDRHLGWIDVGATSFSIASVTALASKNLDAQLQSLPQDTLDKHQVPVPASNLTIAREGITNRDERLDPYSDKNSSNIAPSPAAMKMNHTPIESQRDGELMQSSLHSQGNRRQKLVRFDPDSKGNDEEEQSEPSPTHQGNEKKARSSNSDEEKEGQRPEELVICMPVDNQDDLDANSDATTSSSVDEALFEREDEERDQGMEEDEGDENNSNSDDQESDKEVKDDEDIDDGNPAAGCVCGEIHCARYKVFWIQCDDCDAWYNVARRCVGFSEEEAEEKGKWSCWHCNPPEDSDDEEEPKTQNDDSNGVAESDDDGYGSESTLDQIYARRKRRIRKPDTPPKRDPNRVLKVGTNVEVEPEGSHMFGGYGEIVASEVDEDGALMYSVKYTIHRYVETGIPAEYVVEQDW